MGWGEVSKGGPACTRRASRKQEESQVLSGQGKHNLKGWQMAAHRYCVCRQTGLADQACASLGLAFTAETDAWHG